MDGGSCRRKLGEVRPGFLGEDRLTMPPARPISNGEGGEAVGTETGRGLVNEDRARR